MDKINFIRCYAAARKVGLTKKIILSGWRVTGNWPISRTKALRHPEIQEDKTQTSPEPTAPYLNSDDTPKTSRHIRDLGKSKTPATRRRYAVIAKGFESQEQVLAAHAIRIANLEEEVARLKRGKKRKVIPNPNRRFINLSEMLAAGKAIPEAGEANPAIAGGQRDCIVVDTDSEEEVASEAGVVSEAEVKVASEPPQRTTRSGRIIKKPRYE